MQQHRTCLQWIKKEYKVVSFMIITVNYIFMWISIRNGHGKKKNTWFKVLGLLKFCSFYSSVVLMIVPLIKKSETYTAYIHSPVLIKIYIYIYTEKEV